MFICTLIVSLKWAVHDMFTNEGIINMTVEKGFKTYKNIIILIKSFL